jgi:hypothetical protein
LRLQLIGGTISDIARKEQMTYDAVLCALHRPMQWRTRRTTVTKRQFTKPEIRQSPGAVSRREIPLRSKTESRILWPSVLRATSDFCCSRLMVIQSWCGKFSQ